MVHGEHSQCFDMFRPNSAAMAYWGRRSGRRHCRLRWLRVEAALRRVWRGCKPWLLKLRRFECFHSHHSHLLLLIFYWFYSSSFCKRFLSLLNIAVGAKSWSKRMVETCRKPMKNGNYRLSTGDWDSFHRNEVNKIEVMEVEGCEILH